MNQDLAGILGAILDGMPALDGALCREEVALYDRSETDPAAAEAISLCEICPALQACAEWLATLKPSERPPQVTAGQRNDRKPKRKPAEGDTAA